MRNPERAVFLLGELRDKMLAISQNPYLYQRRPELGESSRVLNYKGYNIVFSIDDESVLFERIVPDFRDLTRIT